VFPTLKTSGVALFAISYDSIAILSAFAKAHGIGYPLLSDEGSLVMRRLGLINERVQEDHAVYGIAPTSKHVNLPYPGVFVLDETGKIARKVFHESYRERDTGAGLIAETLGIVAGRGGAETVAGDETVRVRAWLDSPTYCMFERLHLTVELAVEPGYHIYGQPIPQGYVPLSVDVAPIAGLELRPMQWPSPHSFSVQGLNEKFWVHEGTVRGVLPFAFTAPPGAGDQVLKATVRYQACSAATCLPPESVRLELPVRETALVGRSLPTKAATA
jgi:cytochrome c biogenesis DsbD-like protein/AhpC/TSA family protein